MPSLFVIQGQDQGKRFELDRVCTTIGRDTINHVRLNDSETSRQHAEFRQDDIGESFYVTDLGSSNGTYVNGKQIERHVLQSGDRLQLGSTLLIFTGRDVGAVGSGADSVDIVKPHDEESQIVSSFPHDENSQFFYGDAADSESPWLARARSNLQVMYRTALAVSHTLDIDELLERIMELIFEWVEADRGCILLKDRITNELVARARMNRPGIESDEKLTISQTILDYVLDKSEGVLTSDAREDDRFDAAGSIVRTGVREAIGVPMQGRYGVVGVIYIDTFTPPGDFAIGSSKKFNEEHLKMMIAIAHQAALAVEDTAYYSAMLQSERLAAIGQTIAGLSHHVKNILQGIRGGSYLIEEGLKSSEADLVRTGWGIVDKNQEKISRLVLDMLTFSKEREPEISNADLRDTVADVVELMECRARDCGIELRFEHDDSIPKLRFDREGIHHALLNIVANAIDACETAKRGKPDLSWAEDLVTKQPTTDEQENEDLPEIVDESDASDPFKELTAEVERALLEDELSLSQFTKQKTPEGEEDDPFPADLYDSSPSDQPAPDAPQPSDEESSIVDDEVDEILSQALAVASEDEIESDAPGNVIISTHYLETARRVEVRVKDDGEGIAEADLAGIFVVFNSTKGNRGTGLGLSVSQKILHEHGGDIRVSSSQGKGSTFTLVLPIVLADTSEDHASTSEKDSPAAEAPPNEDEAGMSENGSTAAQEI